MDASSSQGPFILAALIAVILNSVFSESDSEKTAQQLTNEQTNTQIVQMHSVNMDQRRAD